MTDQEKAELAAKDKQIAALQAQLAAAAVPAKATGEYAAQENELRDLLSNGPKPLSDLPAKLQDPKFLARVGGLIEVSRPPHYFNSKNQLMPGDGAMAWSGCTGPGKKTLPELLQEEQQLAASGSLQRDATIPLDFGGGVDDKSVEQRRVKVDARLHIRLAARN